MPSNASSFFLGNSRTFREIGDHEKGEQFRSIRRTACSWCWSTSRLSGPPEALEKTNGAPTVQCSGEKAVGMAMLEVARAMFSGPFFGGQISRS